jgi:DNA invertase Pin-like site-specific DNA recombinase
MRNADPDCRGPDFDLFKAMFQMMGVFAEFERSMIRERVNAGMARAKAQGVHCGRPFIDGKLEGRIRDEVATPGRPGVRVIAKQFGVGTSTVQRIAAQAV